MLIGFEHIGMTSSNLDRTIAFYCDLLELKLVLRKPQATGELAFLDAGGGMLEIIAPNAKPIAPSRDVGAGEAGMRHMTLSYDDIDPVMARLIAAGAEIVEAPRLAYNTEVLKRVAFVRDPDGIIVELAERSPTWPGKTAS